MLSGMGEGEEEMGQALLFSLWDKKFCGTLKLSAGKLRLGQLLALSTGKEVALRCVSL